MEDTLDKNAERAGGSNPKVTEQPIEAREAAARQRAAALPERQVANLKLWSVRRDAATDGYILSFTGEDCICRSFRLEAIDVFGIALAILDDRAGRRNVPVVQ